MKFSQLKIYNFRNFSDLSIQFNPDLNLFYGENGSGKTCLLECLYFLSYGKSFRTHLSKRLIQDDLDKFTLFAKLLSQNNQKETLGIEKNHKGEGTFRLSGEKALVSDVASRLPIQILNNDSFLLLNDGPRVRREFLDWGLFHVKPSFLLSWRSYQRTLKQRNLAIKMKLSKDEIKSWNALLIKSALELTESRREYTAQFVKDFLNTLSEIFTFAELDIRFYQGWPENVEYQDILKNNIQKDLDLGYTYYGAHRADLKITIKKKPIEDVLSRGQQKIFVWLMKITQALILTKNATKKPIFLIDDLGAELDQIRLEGFCKLFQSIPGQLFVTGISTDDLDFFTRFFTGYSRFHVKHNTIIEDV